MFRFNNKLLATSLLMLGLMSCSNTRPNGATTSINQQTVSYSYVPVAQRPQPTLIFQSGLGDDKTVWQAVIQGLAQQVSTFSYDRAGYGNSAASHSERSPCQIAQEQHQLLQNAGVKPPYLLVGHSLGGLYEYVYAQLYPEEVAGLVLLDPTHPQHLQRIKTDLPHIATLLSTANILLSPAARREFKAQQTCLQTLKPTLDTRITVRLLVSSQRQAFEQGAFEQLLKELALDWQRMTHVPHIQTIASGHYIQREQPEAVIAAIHELLTIKQK